MNALGCSPPAFGCAHGRRRPTPEPTPETTPEQTQGVTTLAKRQSREGLLSIFSEKDPRPVLREGSRRAGWALLAGTLFVALVLSLLPAPYVIDRPGPTYDTLGTVSVDDQEVPLIRLVDQPEYPERAQLRVTTVTRVGNPDALPSWVEVVQAWFAPERSVTPVDEAFPPGISIEQNREAALIDMENSQQEAIAAALAHLNIEFDSSLEVATTVEGGPSEGVLQEGDLIVRAAGQRVGDVTALRGLIADNGVQSPITLDVLRTGDTRTVEVIPRMSEGQAPIPVIGVLVAGRYDFPVQVEIELGSVGGPSAGLLFALGLVEKLTQEQVAGSLQVAGSGTITAGGDVGPVGGIRHKVFGAAQAGAEWFLIPRANCADVVGLSPGGITVIPVDTLADAVDALELVMADRELPRCE